MNYLIHASLLLAGCFAYYWLLLRKETHFQLNRWVLLGCLVGSLTLPLLTVPAAWTLRQNLIVEVVPPTKAPAETPTIAEVESSTTTELTAATDEATDLPPMEPGSKAELTPLPEQKTKISTSIEKEPTTVSAAIDWWKIVRWVYLAGLLVFGMNFLVQFIQLVFRLIRYPGHDLGNYRLVEMSEDTAPFSFWNRIFLNPDRYDSDTFHQIFQHEQIHVQQKHSIDLLLAELVAVVQWFNPFAWMYRAAVEDNLEYLTDAEMLRIGNDPESYQLSLVKVAVPNFPNGLVASYNQNFLEKRITMMKAKKSSLRTGWKYFTLLPLLLVSVLQFNAVAQAPVPAAPAEPVAPTAIIAPPIAPTPNPAPAPAPVSPDGVTVPTPMATPVPVPTPVPVDVPVDAATPQVDLDMATITEDALAGAWEEVNEFRPEAVSRMAEKMRVKWDDKLEGGINSWTAIIDGSEICFQFMSRSNSFDNRYQWNSSRCFDRSDFGDLPQNNMGEFYLEREAGKMTFKGVFEGDDGVGNFTFAPSTIFVATLKSQGYGTYDDRELLLFFMADMNAEYLRYVKSQGYDPSHQKLLELAIFYEDLDELKQRVATVKRLGYGQPKLSKLIELQIHGVDEDYIEDLSSAGFDDLSLGDLTKAKIHGLSSRFVTEMNKAGFQNLTFDRLTQLAIHGVSVEYVNELKDLGFDNLNPKEVLQSKIHGVSTERIAEFQRAGFNNLTLDEAKQMAIHGVNGDLVRALADFGFEDLTVDQVVSAKIHGFSERRLRAFKSTGLEMDDLNELQSAFIHGVSAEQIKGFRAIGYDELGIKEFTTARIHGISPKYAASFGEVGFKNIPFDTLVKLRIHGVTANFIKDRLKEGRDLKDYIKMKIHGL